MIVKVKREKEVGNLLVVRSKARLVELGLVKVVSEISVLHFGQILIATHCIMVILININQCGPTGRPWLRFEKEPHTFHDIAGSLIAINSQHSI